MRLNEYLFNRTCDLPFTKWEDRRDYRQIMYREGAVAIALGALATFTGPSATHALATIAFAPVAADYALRARGGCGDAPASGLVGIIKSLNVFRKTGSTAQNQTSVSPQRDIEYPIPEYLGGKSSDFPKDPKNLLGYRRLLYIEGAAALIAIATHYFVKTDVEQLAGYALTAFFGLDYLVRSRGNNSATPVSGLFGILKEHNVKKAAKKNSTPTNPSATGGGSP